MSRMKKKFLHGVIFLLALMCLPVHGYSAGGTPEQIVRDFYGWYFKTDSGPTPAEYNDGIYAYVAEQTVHNVRACQDGVYYFTKMGSYSAEWNDVKVLAGDAVTINEGIFIVPVTFILKSGSRTVISVVRKENGKLRITKVIDPCPY